MADNDTVVTFIAQVADSPTVQTEIHVSEAKLRNDIRRGIWDGVIIWRIGPDGAEQIHDGG